VGVKKTRGGRTKKGGKKVMAALNLSEYKKKDSDGEPCNQLVPRKGEQIVQKQRGGTPSAILSREGGEKGIPPAMLVTGRGVGEGRTTPARKVSSGSRGDGLYKGRGKKYSFGGR